MTFTETPPARLGVGTRVSVHAIPLFLHEAVQRGAKHDLTRAAHRPRSSAPALLVDCRSSHTCRICRPASRGRLRGEVSAALPPVSSLHLPRKTAHVPHYITAHVVPNKATHHEFRPAELEARVAQKGVHHEVVRRVAPHQLREVHQPLL